MGSIRKNQIKWHSIKHLAGSLQIKRLRNCLRLKKSEKEQKKRKGKTKKGKEREWKDITTKYSVWFWTGSCVFVCVYGIIEILRKTWMGSEDYMVVIN